MKQIIDSTLDSIARAGNLRTVQEQDLHGTVDFSSNDYLGLAARRDLREDFFGSIAPADIAMSASASRLLAGDRSSFASFERTISEAYGGRPTLLFNSGYHANTGLVSAFAGTGAYILADKLVHASIIDGIKLSGLPFARFRHNDYSHLAALAAKAHAQGHKLIIIAESIYSMDGDSADIDALAEVKRSYPGSLLYIDEAHAVGVAGPAGLGLAMASARSAEVDIIVGTLGKALASTGAYAVMDASLRSFMINRARSFIFSTAMPPLCARWGQYIFTTAMGMDSARSHLSELCRQLATGLAPLGGSGGPSHIQALICGDPHRAVALSQQLAERGFTVLPIRTPTVPPGTDRLRLSLSAAMTPADINGLISALQSTINGK
ncbi:MAG: aminotransferase class I/II-fold pyridoxal phosphate-dependent enzyme [Muribaculaceae bacterium]|nr:aminotransferase class I/II-fold pyridoxal phosphate-dependent enzyme [Muribaculaceae bacterium]